MTSTRAGVRGGRGGGRQVNGRGTNTRSAMVNRRTNEIQGNAGSTGAPAAGPRTGSEGRGVGGVTAVHPAGVHNNGAIAVTNAANRPQAERQFNSSFSQGATNAGHTPAPAVDTRNLDDLYETSSDEEQQQGQRNDPSGAAASSQEDRTSIDTRNKIAFYFKTVRKGTRDGGKVAQLRNVVRTAVCPRLKFIHGEGFSASARKLEAEILGSFECPDLTKRKGYHYVILKKVGLFNPDKTVVDRVEYWKTYRDDVRKVILQERSSKTQAIKDCVIKGRLNYVEAKADTESEIQVAERKEYAAKLLEMAATDQGLFKIRSDCGVNLEERKKLFGYFVELCLVHMIKKENWKLFKTVKLLSDIFTEADEALAIVLFENNAEEWQMIVEDKEVDAKSRKRKFTHRKSGSPDNSERTKGWVMAGIKRYNMLIDNVRMDRKKDVEESDSWRWEVEMRREYNRISGMSPGVCTGGTSTDTTADGMNSSDDERVTPIDLFELDEPDDENMNIYEA